MPRHGELTYYDAIGEAGRLHACGKPFTDENRGPVLMQVGAILRLLPPPPARVLECGCGTGWLSLLLHKCGYLVTGIDVSPRAIELCRSNPVLGEFAHPPEFLVADAESLSFEGEYDVVLFFAALHHSVDEQAAVSSAYRALKPGGVCVAYETGPGHEEKSQDAIDRYGVTEKDMPPHKIIRLAKAAGFSRCETHPAADEIGKRVYPAGGAARGLRSSLFNWLACLAMLTVFKRSYGITVMRK